MCLEIYELNPTHFLSTPGLPLQAALWDKKILEEKYSLNLLIYKS